MKNKTNIINKNFGDIFKYSFWIYKGDVLDSELTKILSINKELVINGKTIDCRDVLDLLNNNEKSLHINSNLIGISSKLSFTSNNSTIYINLSDDPKVSKKVKFVTISCWKYLITKNKISPKIARNMIEDFSVDFIKLFNHNI